MNKVLITILLTLVVLLFMAQMGWLELFGIHRVSTYQPNEEPAKSDSFDYVTDKQTGVRYRVKADGDYFFVYQNGEWKQIFLTGVNIGAGQPGTFPGELTVTYETYYRWFQYISGMNCNCVRVYTIMRPQFYKALYDFNSQAENPLYLFQGIWMNEEDIGRLYDVYAENMKILTEFKQTSHDIINVIHGNVTLPPSPGVAFGTYTSDVSKWFGGFIIGIEWEPSLVKNTNDMNPSRNAFDGKYLYTQAATPFEAFLCEIGNDMIEYQTEKYNFQAPISFTNWITTDPLTHPEEPHFDEDSVTVNTESIKSRTAFATNMFATYHVYPYYPDSLNYQKDYLSYIDEDGKMNTYRAYLKDLKLAHTMPILVAEFGVPTSRGKGHESVMGYDQGNIDEVDQGDILLDMFHSIFEENYAGGILFTWQDEWFKRTWNNVNFDIADRRPFWSNIQTTEQCFGLLSFDPGNNERKVYVDAQTQEWAGKEPVLTNEQGSVFAESDERYLYLMVNAPSYNFDTDSLYIPIDIIENQGNLIYKGEGVTFDSSADFVICINGEDNSRIVVDQYYDAFYYQYGELYKMMSLVGDVRTKNSGVFNPMRMCFGYDLVVPTTREIVPFKYFETGRLIYGNANPKSEDYRSLADFCYGDGRLEIKIPWQLLNIMDPSERKVMDDFYTTQVFKAIDFEFIRMGLGIKPSGAQSVYIFIDGQYSYDKWSWPTYHERLKPAYYELQEGLKKYHEE